MTHITIEREEAKRILHVINSGAGELRQLGLRLAGKTLEQALAAAPVQEPAKRVCNLGCKNLGACCADPMCEAVATTPTAQPAVQDAEGENKAVRSFLMLYGQPGLTVGQMKKHMTMSGFKAWPAWVETEPHGAHLTKAGAQLWIRHLFALEVTPPAQPAPVPLTDELSNAVQMACQLSFKDHGRRSVNEQAWQRLMQAVAAYTHGITEKGNT
jgi:hypothetical protein